MSTFDRLQLNFKCIVFSMTPFSFLWTLSELQSDRINIADLSGRIQHKFVANKIIQTASQPLFLPLLILAVSLLYICQVGPLCKFCIISLGKMQLVKGRKYHMQQCSTKTWVLEEQAGGIVISSVPDLATACYQLTSYWLKIPRSNSGSRMIGGRNQNWVCCLGKRWKGRWKEVFGNP